MKAAKEKILAFLIANKKYRKSDRTLMARIWYEDLLHRIHDMSALDFLNELAKDNLSNWESMTRIRRKIQEEYPELKDPDITKKREALELEYKIQYSPRDTL
jgi:hypothetical protein